MIKNKITLTLSVITVKKEDVYQGKLTVLYETKSRIADINHL